MSGLELLLGAAAIQVSGMLRGKQETTQELLRALQADDPAFEALTPLAASQTGAAKALLVHSLADDLALQWVSGPENGGKHRDLLEFVAEWYLHLARSCGHCLCALGDDRSLRAVALLLPPRIEEGMAQRVRATMAVGLPPIDKDVGAWGRHCARRFAAWHSARAAMHDEAVPASSSVQAGMLPGAWAGPRQPHWRLLLMGVGGRDAASGAVVAGEQQWALQTTGLLFRAMAAAADRDGWMCYAETTGSPEHATFRMAAIIAQFEVVRQRPLECAPVEAFSTNGGLCALTRRPQEQQRLQGHQAGDGSSSMMSGVDG